jgi:hypothetical protein
MSRKAMSEERKAKTLPPAEEVIAAFDRQRAEAHELHRRHNEQVRASRAHDRPVSSERHKRQP